MNRLIVSLMMFTLAGCGEATDSNESPSNQTSVNLRVASYCGDDKTIWIRVVAKNTGGHTETFKVGAPWNYDGTGVRLRVLSKGEDVPPRTFFPTWQSHGPEALASGEQRQGDIPLEFLFPGIATVRRTNLEIRWQYELNTDRHTAILLQGRELFSSDLCRQIKPAT
jgi:hypothetical protein